MNNRFRCIQFCFQGLLHIITQEEAEDEEDDEDTDGERNDGVLMGNGNETPENNDSLSDTE